MSATPLTDAAAAGADPLGLDQPAVRLLRQVEGEARDLLERLRAVADGPTAHPVARSALTELAAFLADAARSVLRRGLRRPLRHMHPRSPGGASLRGCADGLFARVRRAIALQEMADRVLRERQALHDAYAADLPHLFGRVLEEERLTDAHLAAARYDGDAVRMLGRMDAAAATLAHRARFLPPGEPPTVPAGWAVEASPSELLAGVALGLEFRARLRGDAPGPAERRAAAAHLGALAEAGDRARTTRGALDTVAQQLASTVPGRGAAMAPGEDQALWSGLVASASAAVFDPASPLAWAPQISATPPAVATDSGSAVFVVPFDGEFALLSPAHPSAARVHRLAIRVGATVDCAAFLEDGGPESLPLARMDLDPLFDGLEASPAWYATARRARLRVLLDTGDGAWIARVERRGVLRRAPQHPCGPGGADTFLRVVASSDQPGDAPLPVRGGDDGWVFAGLRTRTVDAPVRGVERAWLRTAAGEPIARASLAAEAEVFAAVGRVLPHTVPRLLGRGIHEGADSGVLYVPPLGVRAADSPLLRMWTDRDDVRGMLVAAARLFVRLHDAGFTLGAWHGDALVFRPWWREGGAFAALHCVAATAPHGCQLGRNHRTPAPDGPELPQLRAPAIPAHVRDGAVAMPDTEAQSFVLFALDALLLRALPRFAGITPAQVAEEVLSLPADAVKLPPLVRVLAESLLPGQAASPLPLVQRLAATRMG